MTENKKHRIKIRCKGVEKSTPSRQNQDFDEVDIRINRQVPSAKMPRNLLFSSTEINSVCGLKKGNSLFPFTLQRYQKI